MTWVRLIGPLVALSGLLVLLPAPASTSATDLDAAISSLQRHQRELSTLERELGDTQARLRSTRAERDDLMKALQLRLVAIYKSGSSTELGRILRSGRPLRDALQTASIVRTVSEHDRDSIKRYRKLVKRAKSLNADVGAYRKDIDKVRAEIELDREELAELKRKAAAAEARRQRLARVKQSPLAPQALSPQSVIEKTQQEEQTAPPEPAGYSESGIASVYADDFAGESTASGEPYDPAAMTAAHKTLPLGTWVIVQGSGGSVLVRINDRGPYIGGRIIDLSRAAAEAINLPGLGQVTITVQQ